MSSPTPYKIGTCYGCQKCLFCFIDLKNNSCSCNKNIKPSRSNTIPDRTVRGQQIYNRNYKISTTHILQTNWLKECNKVFGYQSNFDLNFDMTFCSACNSKYDRAKTLRAIKKSSISSQSNNNEIEIIEIDKPIISELKVKIIIDTKKSNSSPSGKWFTLTTETIEDFYLFKFSLNSHVQKCLNVQTINEYDYDISYKINGRGQAMCVSDEVDFVNFINECKDLSNNQQMYIYIVMKKLTNQKHNMIRDNEDEDVVEKSSKRLRTNNYTPKESDLDEVEYKQAQIINELRLKYKCFHHVTPCYIEDGRHLQLNSARLILWARDIVCISKLFYKSIIIIFI